MKDIWLLIFSAVTVITVFSIVICIFVYIPILSYIIVILLIAAGTFFYWRYILSFKVEKKNMSPKITVKVMKDGNESFEVSFDVSKDTVCAGRENNNDIVRKSADWIDEKQFSVFKKSEENDIYYIKNTSNNHSMYTVGAEPEIVRGEYQLYSKSQNTFRIFNPENEEYYVEIIIEI